MTAMNTKLSRLLASALLTVALIVMHAQPTIGKEVKDVSKATTPESWVAGQISTIELAKHGQFEVLTGLLTLKLVYLEYCRKNGITCSASTEKSLDKAFADAEKTTWSDDEIAFLAKGLFNIDRALALQKALSSDSCAAAVAIRKLKSTFITQTKADLKTRKEFQLVGSSYAYGAALKILGVNIENSIPGYFEQLDFELKLYCIPVNLSFSEPCPELQRFMSLPGDIPRKTLPYEVQSYNFGPHYDYSYAEGSSSSNSANNKTYTTKEKIVTGRDIFGNATSSYTQTTTSGTGYSSFGRSGPKSKTLTGYGGNITGLIGSPINKDIGFTDKPFKTNSRFLMNYAKAVRVSERSFGEEFFRSIPQYMRDEVCAAYIKKAANTSNQLYIEDLMIAAYAKNTEWVFVDPRIAFELGISKNKLTGYLTGVYSPVVSDILFTRYAQNLQNELYGLTGQKAPEIETEETDKDAVGSVVIGDQVWKTKNLNVAVFRNGDAIPEASTVNAWLEADRNRTPAWCYCANDPGNETKYGKLYNWYAVNDPRGLAPQGWHVPSNNEWRMLCSTLGGSRAAGNQLKSTWGWKSDKGENSCGSNSSGFTAEPGGYFHFGGGAPAFDDNFFGFGTQASWWSTTDKGNGYVKYWHIDLEPGVFIDYNTEINAGRSVRLIKD